MTTFAEGIDPVRREYQGSGARYDFPARPLGRGRLIALFLFAFGAIFAWIPAHNLWRVIQHSLHGTAGSASIVFVLLSVPFLIAGCGMIGAGLFIFAGRSRIEWKDGQLRAAEILGPLRWTRRLPRSPI